MVSTGVYGLGHLVIAPARHFVEAAAVETDRPLKRVSLDGRDFSVLEP